MSDDPRRTPDIWEEIVACRRRGEAAALATIVSTLGSTPGKDPMKMLVRGDGTFVGSVGGGCLEAEVWETAREVMQSLRPTTLEFSLNEQDYPDSGLICGGRVTIFIEPLTRPALHVFGAGHVGLATARLAAEAGFGATLYDDCDDMLAADRVGADVAVRPGEFEQTAALLREYAAWRTKVGLEDDSLSREPGVFRELRKRHTMRLLDPSGATRYQQQQQEQQQEQQQQSLTFLELHSPSMWPTARDRDGCPVVYTNMEQYQRGASKAVGAVQV